MKFHQYKISKNIKERLEELNLNRPTDIQFKAIPHILDNEDVLGIAQTGTGKTAAFVIPILHRIQARKFKNKLPEGIQCVVMVPTRELAIQIAEVFDKIGANTNIKTFALFGGAEQEKQISTLTKGIDVLVTTPGRMFDLRSQGHINFKDVKTLVVDEADHMLNLGFLKDIQDVIRYLPQKRQTLFFSATIDAKIKKLAYSLISSKAIRIQISPKDPVSNKVEHSVMFVEMDDKRFFLERIIKENPDSKIIVFVRTKVRAERVYKAMERVGILTETLHGDKTQEERTQAMADFKSGDERILIATDISARGIDVHKVDMVINYDLPDVAENYVHRIGRTGRGDHKGLAISFCSTEEKEMLVEIEKYITKDVQIIDISKSEVEETINLGGDKVNDWKSVMGKIDDFDSETKRRKKKK